MTRLIVVLGLLASSVACYAALKKPAAKFDDGAFYVYSNKGDRGNKFAPSGWMGDFGDLKINDASTDDCIDGKTCTKWTYSAKGSQGANWAGVFYQNPPNNWGEKKGGYDLSAYKKLTFWAKGEKGGEKIAEFKVGGITGEFGDSDAQSIGPVELTKEWKKYVIDLSDKNLQHIIGGFCFAFSRDDNSEGLAFYLDEIRYEK